jgi:hypothetical protein
MVFARGRAPVSHQKASKYKLLAALHRARSTQAHRD